MEPLTPLYALICLATLLLGLGIGFFMGRKGDNKNILELKGALEATLSQKTQSDHSLRQELENRLGSVSDQTTKALASMGEQTGQHLSQLSQRLAVIDHAQQQMGALSTDVTDLRMLLSNKQTRGAFGEMRMNDILENIFPPNAYSLQHTLSNGKRADALLLESHSSTPMAIDAKFPLESYQHILDADTKDALDKARRTFRSDMMTHIKAVSEKYIIPGETGDSALLFLPAESIYTELHAQFEDVVQEAMKRSVWIVSPTTLMAVLITLRGIARDSLVFKEADNIKKELNLLSKDVGRLLERSTNLTRHMEQVHGDLDSIAISAEKVKKRSDKLSTLEFEE